MNKSVCSICADFLTCENSVACPCGHTFHSQCINRWKVEKSSCPQCRVPFKVPVKLYFELSRDDRAEGDPAELKNEVTELKLQLRVRDSSIETLTKEKKAVAEESKSKDHEIKSQKHLLESALGTNDALKKQLTYMEKYKNDAKKAKGDLLAYEKKMESFKNIQKLIDTESHDIETTIKSFADSTDSFNQISTSYVVLKKEFDRLKESKRVLENEKKSYRKKVESSAREASECKEQVKVVTDDLKQLNSLNKRLSEKVKRLERLEKLHRSKSRSTAVKRLHESVETNELKRQCVNDMKEGAVEKEYLKCSSTDTVMETVEEEAEESLVLFNDHTEDADSGNYEGDVQDLNMDQEESIKIADEFGLPHVAITSVVSERKPLKDVTKKMSFAPKQRPGTTHNAKQKPSGATHNSKLQQNENSDLPHFKRGFNGMGGQSKTLIIPPKKAGISSVRLGPAKKTTVGFSKIPKNNTKITKFIAPQSSSTPGGS